MPRMYIGRAHCSSCEKKSCFSYKYYCVLRTAAAAEQSALILAQNQRSPVTGYLTPFGGGRSLRPSFLRPGYRCGLDLRQKAGRVSKTI